MKIQTCCSETFYGLITSNPSIEFCIYLNDFTTITSYSIDNIEIATDEFIEDAN